MPSHLVFHECKHIVQLLPVGIGIPGLFKWRQP